MRRPAVGRFLRGPASESDTSRLSSQDHGAGLEVWPRSAKVKLGVSYSFNTGHCGLGYLTDFDGSFWDPINPNGQGDPPSFFYNEDDGTMKLVSRDTAIYTASTGRRVRLKRHPGPVTLDGLCA